MSYPRVVLFGRRRCFSRFLIRHRHIQTWKGMFSRTFARKCFSRLSKAIEAIPRLPPGGAPLLSSRHLPPARSTSQGKQHRIPREHAHNDRPRCGLAPARVTATLTFTTLHLHVHIRTHLRASSCTYLATQRRLRLVRPCALFVVSFLCEAYRCTCVDLDTYHSWALSP